MKKSLIGELTQVQTFSGRTVNGVRVPVQALCGSLVSQIVGGVKEATDKFSAHNFSSIVILQITSEFGVGVTLMAQLHVLKT